MSTSPVRTRFAPSPTGFIHLGNIRSALYPWAFARSQKGSFILRVEDTDVERSTQASVDVILEGMRWLGLDYDEGPFFQMQRMDRYRAVLAHMQEKGLVYPCYMSIQELDQLRDAQMAAKQKPRYDGRWRPEAGKILPPVPSGVQPVLRFKNPLTGTVVWDDKVKGRIEVHNSELDDLVIARPDGTPTYNFCVVVDDIDMAITHVIRGDDHVNNTPRQINIFKALEVLPPVYAHLPTVLNEQGEKMSKRNGAKAVTTYAQEGFLPQAMINYLARLGWSHGDEEIFSTSQFLQWFDLDHLGKSAAQFDEAKLKWVNAQHIKACDNDQLAHMITPALRDMGVVPDANLAPLCGLFKDRCDTTVVLAHWVAKCYLPIVLNPDDKAKYLTQSIQPALLALAERLKEVPWTVADISAAIKSCLTDFSLKMPMLAMPARTLVIGQAQAPSLDAMVALMNREIVVNRLLLSDGKDG